jgi:hypothetical protein
MRTLKATVALFALFSSLASAHPITVDATGVVTQVLAADPFGTSVGDQITLRAVFDSSALTDIGDLFGFGFSIPGLQFASLATDPGASLSIDLGDRRWTALDEPLFGSDLGGLFPTPLPHVVLLNGDFFGLNYFGIGPSDDVLVSDAIGQLYFGSPAGQIFGGDSNPAHPPTWIGQWDLEHATVSVQEPGTLPLMLLGIGGLVWRLRRAADPIPTRS